MLTIIQLWTAAHTECWLKFTIIVHISRIPFHSWHTKRENNLNLCKRCSVWDDVCLAVYLQSNKVRRLPIICAYMYGHSEYLMASHEVQGQFTIWLHTSQSRWFICIWSPLGIEAGMFPGWPYQVTWPVDLLVLVYDSYMDSFITVKFLYSIYIIGMFGFVNDCRPVDHFSESNPQQVS